MSRRSRVLIVSSSYLPNVGGLQRVTSQLAEGLLGTCDRVTVITQKYPRSLAEKETINGVPILRMMFMVPSFHQIQRNRIDLFLAGLIYFPVCLARMVWYLFRERPDIVNLHFVGAPTLFLLIAHVLLNFRLIVSLHGDDVESFADRTGFEQWQFRAILKHADVVTACSSYLLNRAQAIEPSIMTKARVIHNGIEATAETSVTGPKRIVAVGRQVRKKGFDILLRAWAECASMFPTTKLLLIGGGPEAQNLKKIAQDLQIEPIVEFMGPQDHSVVMNAIATCSVVAIPSRSEPFGVVAIEAMACGKPVLATRVGGLPEVLRDADAIFVEPANPHALAHGLARVLTRIEVEASFGARNRLLAKDFSVQHMLDSYLCCYALSE